VSDAEFEFQQWVPLRIAVLSRTSQTYDRLMTDGRLEQQVAAINRAHRRNGIWFYIESVLSYNDERMVNSCNTDPCYSSLDCDFFSYTVPNVKGDSSQSIPLILCDEITYLGEAQFPWADVEDSQFQYIEVHAKTIGISGPNWPTGMGYTLVHELGHYFGLFHVFEKSGECNAVGDWVSDTAPASTATSRSNSCGLGKDTCAQLGGFDPLDNYMDYSRDECMVTGFTQGQYARMRQGARKFRPLLLANTAMRPEHGACPGTALTISQCSCTNASMLPITRCTSDQLRDGSIPEGNITAPSWLPETSRANPNTVGDDGLSDTTLAIIVASVLLATVTN
jgi:hypothetical protein